MKPGLSMMGIISMVTALTGCAPKGTPASEEAGAHDSHARQIGVTFNSKQGLSVPAETAKFIDLRVADVEERTMTGSVRFSARVYRTVSEHQIASGAPPATAMALASAVVSPATARLLTNGQVAVVTVKNAASLQGKVAAVNRSLESVQGQAEIMLAMEDPGARLTKGDHVSISVPVGGERSFVTIPRSALLRTTEGDFVYTVSGKQFVRAAIQTDDVSDESVEVRDGLFSGDRIVVQPVMTLWLAELQSIRAGKACADGH